MFISLSSTRIQNFSNCYALFVLLCLFVCLFVYITFCSRRGMEWQLAGNYLLRKSWPLNVLFPAGPRRECFRSIILRLIPWPMHHRKATWKWLSLEFASRLFYVFQSEKKKSDIHRLADSVKRITTSVISENLSPICQISFWEIIFEKLQNLKRMYELINVLLPTKVLQVLIAAAVFFCFWLLIVKSWNLHKLHKKTRFF